MIRLKLYSARRVGVLGWALSGALAHAPIVLAADSDGPSCPIAPPLDELAELVTLALLLPGTCGPLAVTSHPSAAASSPLPPMNMVRPVRDSSAVPPTAPAATFAFNARTTAHSPGPEIAAVAHFLASGS